jgi:hypothetical protein
MEDTFGPLLRELLRDVKGLAGVNGTAVVGSQQIAGTLNQRQEPSLSDRVSATREGAEVQKNLEAAKGNTPTTENAQKVDEMSAAVAEKYVDEILGKFLTSLRG